MRSLLILFASLFMLAPALAMNDICAAEFQPLVKGHTEVMAGNKNLPKNKPKTYEQALSNSTAVCSFMTRASGSFTKLQAWFIKNKEFCQIPDQEISNLKNTIATLGKQRADACNSVANLKAQKGKAEQQAALAQSQQNPFTRTAPVVNDPFNPQIVRKPQLTLDK